MLQWSDKLAEHGVRDPQLVAAPDQGHARAAPPQLVREPVAQARLVGDATL